MRDTAVAGACAAFCARRANTSRPCTSRSRRWDRYFPTCRSRRSHWSASSVAVVVVVVCVAGGAGAAAGAGAGAGGRSRGGRRGRGGVRGRRGRRYSAVSGAGAASTLRGRAVGARDRGGGARGGLVRGAVAFASTPPWPEQAPRPGHGEWSRRCRPSRLPLERSRGSGRNRGRPGRPRRRRKRTRMGMLRRRWRERRGRGSLPGSSHCIPKRFAASAGTVINRGRKQIFAPRGDEGSLALVDLPS